MDVDTFTYLHIHPTGCCPLPGRPFSARIRNTNLSRSWPSVTAINMPSRQRRISYADCRRAAGLLPSSHPPARTTPNPIQSNPIHSRVRVRVRVRVVVAASDSLGAGRERLDFSLSPLDPHSEPDPTLHQLNRSRIAMLSSQSSWH
ncbi:uncharacterized protein LOC109707487 [Ananas comosus]|uniref:Uncharacterized protein LOC109707487 n=1 Tax=Ananas comosus TaxID=4615 RepID=A0A6P5ELM9_ANACO|nr:uncharacterized protein LOC109707487 [Ananas comosus]